MSKDYLVHNSPRAVPHDARFRRKWAAPAGSSPIGPAEFLSLDPSGHLFETSKSAPAAWRASGDPGVNFVPGRIALPGETESQLHLRHAGGRSAISHRRRENPPMPASGRMLALDPENGAGPQPKTARPVCSPIANPRRPHGDMRGLRTWL